MKASLGRIVLVTGKHVEANGTDVAPAVITRVWGDDLVNLSILVDLAGEVRRATSIRIHEDGEAARAWIEEHRRSGDFIAAYWPPRV